MKKSILTLVLVLGVIAGAGGAYIVVPGPKAPREPLVKPGSYDKYYGFFSGGPGGDIRVVGVPSMRLIRRIPVFERNMRYGYGRDDNGNPLPVGERGQRLKSYTWGDTHHPVLSKTDGRNDGRWLFINDKGNGRVAKIDLDTFQVENIVKVPSAQVIHGLQVDPAESHFLAGAVEFQTPSETLDGRHVGGMTVFNTNPLTVKYQLYAPQDVEKYGDFTGGDIIDISKDGKQIFMTIYNSESSDHLAGMIRENKDAVAIIDVETAENALTAGNYKEVRGIPMINVAENEGIVELVPVAKNPHGVSITPNGKYAVASGKLEPTVTVIDVQSHEVLATPQVGLGPLHTTYDGRGNAYTTLFIDSEVVKWDIQKAIQGEDCIIDRIAVHYNPGHLQSVAGYTTYPSGDYLVSLNKLSKTRFLSAGPDMPENNQLIDITGREMKMSYEAPADPEPHDGVFIRREKLDKRFGQNQQVSSE